MKKIIIIIAAVLMLLAGAFGVTRAADYIIDYIRGDVVKGIYYGCPNACRGLRLNLLKSKRIL